MSQVRVIDNTPKVIGRVNSGTNIALRLIAQDIHKTAQPMTPRRTGRLANDVVIQSGSGKTKITWTKVYAAAQEAGRTRGHPIRHYTTGGTGPGYARKAVERVTKNSGAYFKRGIR